MHLKLPVARPTNWALGLWHLSKGRRLAITEQAEQRLQRFSDFCHNSRNTQALTPMQVKSPTHDAG